MLRCQANVLESVRRVTQVNRGKDTPGVDQVIVTTPEERGQLCHRLSQLDLHQAHPVRRGYIPKRKGRRPLGIPMAHAYCISFLRRLGIAVAAATSMNSMYQLTQYSGLGLTNQVSACKETSSKVAEHFQWFGFFYFNKNSIPLASYHLLNSTPPPSLLFCPSASRTNITSLIQY
jgi:hypothetical protein